MSSDGAVRHINTSLDRGAAPVDRVELVPPAVTAQRMLSLDVFRGLTIAGMILVNNPGGQEAYAPLRHATWDGWTPTDLIFPFFLFIIGIAMTFSFDKRLARGGNAATLLIHVFGRSAVLFLLGLILCGLPNFRLITPYIFAIAGIQMLLNDTRVGTRNRVAPAGWACLFLGVLWFAVDFRYFNSPAPRDSFRDLFPLQTGTGSTLIRIPGTLQRIALCYAIAAVIMVKTTWRGRAVWSVLLISAYWIIMSRFDAPAAYHIGNGLTGLEIDPPANAPFAGRLNDWIDVRLLGAHLHRRRPDALGLLSTIPAVASVLVGTLTGTWLQKSRQSPSGKVVTMLLAGVGLIVVGSVAAIWMPINKKLWTPSYVAFMAGWALAVLALCYYVVDVLGRRRWALPFTVLGTNAILAYFGSEFFSHVMSLVRWGSGGRVVTLKEWWCGLYAQLIHSPKNAALLWSLVYVALWVLLITPLYRRKIFLKV